MLKDFTKNFLILETLAVWKDIWIVAFNTPTGEPIIYPPQYITGELKRPLITTLNGLRMILLAFQQEKAIKILHEFWGKTLPFHYTLELIEPKFSELESEILEIYKSKTDTSLLESDTTTGQHKINKRELRKQLNTIIRTGKFGTKEREFLKLLTKDFEPKTIKYLSKEIPAKDCKHLKSRLQMKLKQTIFLIKTEKSSGFNSESTYQLIYSPTPVTQQ